MMVGYGVKLGQAKVQSSAALVHSELVAAGPSGSAVQVAAVFVMSDTAGTVALESGGVTTKWEVYPAANGGQNFAAPVGQFLFECDEAEALAVSSDITGEHFVSVLYTVGL